MDGLLNICGELDCISECHLRFIEDWLLRSEIARSDEAIEQSAKQRQVDLED
jgi:hypothetical protein